MLSISGLAQVEFKPTQGWVPIGYPDIGEEDDCIWHFQRNLYNKPAHGSLTYVKTIDEYRDYIGNDKQDPPKQVSYKYYHDESGCIWRKELKEENVFHGDGTVKFTRLDQNGVGSHETILVLQDELYESNYFSGEEQLIEGSKQQTYNYFDHHKYRQKHIDYDVMPHFWLLGGCGDEYYPIGSGEFGTPYEWDDKIGSADGGFPKDSLEIPVVGSMDPNDIIGIAGYGEQQWVSISKVLFYKINFENHPDSATAPAQKVTIDVELDENMDISYFQLGSFGFGSYNFTNAFGKNRYKERIDVFDSVGVYVDVDFNINNDNKIATWNFQSIDANTGLPPKDPYAGFLPVNDTITHKGEGYVSFIIKPKSTTQTGDLLMASADIIFDFNNPIATNIWINTIDASAPESEVISNITLLDSNAYEVSWMGIDDENGSGIKDYSIYYSDTTFKLIKWLENTQESSGIFHGEYGNSYNFYSISRDNVNNIEAKPKSYDALLEIEYNSGIDNSSEVKQQVLSIYPNPADNMINIEYTLQSKSQTLLEIININGQVILTLTEKKQNTGRHHLKLDTGDLKQGIYLCKLRVKNANTQHEYVKKITILK